MKLTDCKNCKHNIEEPKCKKGIERAFVRDTSNNVLVVVGRYCRFFEQKINILNKGRI